MINQDAAELVTIKSLDRVIDVKDSIHPKTRV